jgi:quinol monooxygenase YgiN
MSVVVVATITPLPGRLQDVLDNFADGVPLVHQEKGCELYAAHTDGELVIMVERWTTKEDLDAHAKGEAVAAIGASNAGAVAGPSTVLVLENVTMGEPIKGTIQ